MRLFIALLLLSLAVGCGGNSNDTSSGRQLDSITVQPDTDTLTIGSSTAFVAMGNFHDGKTENLATDGWGVTWSSNDTQTATVNTTGSATCLAVGGPVQITAQAPDFECTGIACPTRPVQMVTGTATLTCH
jgi:uncharacterized protein YjdB